MTAAIEVHDSAVDEAATGVVSPRRGHLVSRWLHWALAVGASLPTASLIARLWRDSGKGLDFTDEGMYLLSADAGSPERSFHNAFGRYTHVLYRLAGGDVARFRILGLLLLAVAAAALGDRLATLAGRLSNVRTPGPVRLAAASAVTAACLHYYLLMLLTPSYNWLNLTGIVVVMASVAHLVGRPAPAVELRSMPTAAWILFMVAGGLAATMGKLSSGPMVALFGFGVLVAFAPGGRADRARWLAWFSAFSAVVLAVHWVLINPLPETIEQIRRGNDALLTLDPAYGLGNAMKSVRDALDQTVEGFVDHSGSAVLIALAAPALSLAALRRGSPRIPAWIGRWCPTFAVVGAFVVAARELHSNGDWMGGGAGYGVLAWVAISYASIALVAAPIAVGAARAAGDPRSVWITVSVASLGLIGAASYAFGSGNGFFAQLNAGLGPVIAVVVLICALSPDPWRIGLSTLTLALVIGLGGHTVIADAEAAPYRQAPLDSQTVPVVVGRSGGTLDLTPETARFVNEIRVAAGVAGWTPGTPLLDLSPYAATVLYLLEARPPITIIPSVGGYSTQQELAEWSIDQIIDAGESSVWSDAWLLVLDDPPQGGIDPGVLARFGRAFPEDYVHVGSFALVARGEVLSLWRPAGVGNQS